MTRSILGRASTRRLLAGAAALSMGAVACGDDSLRNDRVPSMIGPSTSGKSLDSHAEAPEIEDVYWQPRRPMPGRVIEAGAHVSDAHGGDAEVQFRWRSPDGRRLGEGRRFDTTGLEDGDTIELVAVASDGTREGDRVSAEITLGAQSAAIELVAIDASDGDRPGAVLEASVETTDDGQPFEILYEWQVGREVVGHGHDLDTAEIAPGIPIVLSARLEFEDRITRPVRSRPFTLSGEGTLRIASSPPTSLEGGLFRYPMRVSGAASEKGIRFVVAQGPGGMTVDAQSGIVTWHPSRTQRGRFDIEIQVLDRWGSGVAQTFSIQVDDPPPPASAR